MPKETEKEFKAVNIAILTISDRREIEDDDSGDLLINRVNDANHNLIDRQICKDNCYQIRAIVSRWILQEDVHVIITTGGTGITGHDGTPEAILPLLDKTIDGFGEMFRSLSYQHYNPELLQGLLMGHLHFVCQVLQELAKMGGIFLSQNNWIIVQNPAT